MAKPRSRRAPRPAYRPLGPVWDTASVGGYMVRPITAERALKEYRCPGCQQIIPVRMAHVVAWREEEGAQERRHWHRFCFERLR